MKYELAKKLKDAGFPQRFTKEFEHWEENKGNVYYPTLSELIEACGRVDENTQTTFTLKFDFVARKPCWRAGFTNNDFWAKGEFGSTPEEAVANLWFALNSKNV